MTLCELVDLLLSVFEGIRQSTNQPLEPQTFFFFFFANLQAHAVMQLVDPLICVELHVKLISFYRFHRFYFMNNLIALFESTIIILNWIHDNVYVTT